MPANPLLPDVTQVLLRRFDEPEETREMVGLVLTGAPTCAFESGEITVMRPGDLYYIPPTPHDSWVIGDDPYVSLHFLGVDHYAAHSHR